MKNVLKKMLFVVYMMALGMPALLTLSTSSDDEVTLWNLVGLAWIAILLKWGGRLLPRYMRRYIFKLTQCE